MSKYKINEDLNYSLLDDDLIILNEECDYLGNTIYIQELKKILYSSIDNDNAETIALVGSWGAGKSSIVRGLQEELSSKKAKGKKIRFIWYNAWKYNNDSFRKTFLINATESKRKKKKLEEELYQKKTTVNYELDQSFFFCTLLIFLISTFLLIVFVIMTKDYETTLEMILDISTKALGIFAVESIGSIIIRKIFIETSETIEKEFSPAEFSSLYEDVTKANKCFSIYVIDDLDRCDFDQALEILDTIKGYLKIDNKNGMFIIPIDKNRIGKILRTQRKYDLEDINEYFSKIFDVLVDIKEPGNINLFEMVKRISNINKFQLSNFSISLLCDYLITTPRDVKKHLNNLRLETNVLQRQKRLNYIPENAFNNNNFDSFVKIYIIQNRWPRYYNWLIKNYQKVDIDNWGDLSVIMGEEVNEELKILEIFLRVSKSVSIKNLPSYHNLKDDGVNIDNSAISLILEGKSKQAFEYCKKNKLDIVNHFEYSYRIYIEQRELINRFLPQIFNLYLFISNLEDDMSKRLKRSKVNFASLLHLFDEMINGFTNSGESINSLNIFSKEIIKYSNLEDVSSRFFLSFNRYLKLLIKNDDINLIFMILENEDILLNGVMTKNLYLQSLSSIIEKGQDDLDYTKILSSKIYEYMGMYMNDILKVAIKVSNIKYILAAVEIEEQDKDPYIQEILDTLKVIPKLSTSNPQINIDSLGDDIKELMIVNILSTEYYHEIFEKLNKKINISYVNYIVEKVKGIDDEKSTDLHFELVKFYYHYCEYSEEWKPIELYLNKMSSDEDFEVLEFIFNLPMSIELKNDFFVKKISNDYNNDLIHNYVSFLKENNNSKLISYWINLTRDKSRMSFNLKELGTQTTLDYNKYIINVLPSFLKLNDVYIEELFVVLDMDLVFTSPIKEYLCGLRKDNKLLQNIIRRVETLDQYIKMMEIASKKNPRLSAYHDAFRKVVSNARNIDELIRIYDQTISDLDHIDIGVIKKEVEDQYSQYKEKFPRISWEH